MRSSDDRIDLSPLDPEADPTRRARVVAGVLSQLGPGIVDEPGALPDVGASAQPPRVVDDVAGLLARRVRPLAASAAALALASSAVWGVARGPAIAAGDGPDTPTEARSELAWGAWITTGEAPRAEDLLLSLGGSDR